MERHIIGDVPAVDRHMTFAVTVIVCLIVQRMLEWFGTAPGITEIIFRTSAEGGRELLAIHEEFLITLTPPTAAWIPNVEHHTYEPPRAFRLDDGPIDVPLGFGGQEDVAMPLRMETAKSFDGLRERSMNDFKACHARLLAIVEQF